MADNDDTEKTEDVASSPAQGSDALVGDDDDLDSHKLPPEEPAPKECPPCKSGAPAWMATFADMATLLMAFFVLLLSFAETEVPKFKQISGSLKAAFGIEKIVPKITLPMSRSLLVEEFTPAVAERSVINKKEQQSEDTRSEFLVKKTQDGEFDSETELKFQQVQDALREEINRGMAEVKIVDGEISVDLVQPDSAGGKPDNEGRESGGPVAQEIVDMVAKISEVQAQIEGEISVNLRDKSSGASSGGSSDRSSNQGVSKSTSKYDRLRADLSSEINSGLAEVERQGDKIIVRLANQGSFGSGSATLRRDFNGTLDKLGSTLSQYSGSVLIEGHTDNVPVGFSERFKSNWDLSASRAAAVADYLLTDTALAGGKVMIKGYADSKPIGTNDTPTGRANNRRIEVIVDDN